MRNDNEKDMTPSASENGNTEGAHSVSRRQEKAAPTPGPWMHQGLYVTTVNASGPVVARTDYATVSLAEARANARLLAAAPNLLDAAQQVIAAFRHYSLDAGGRYAIALTQAAIAKAEGK